MKKLSKLPHEEKFGNILNCINAGPKSITWAFCLDEDLKTYTDLKNEFVKNVDEESGVIFNNVTLGKYCDLTFSPIGLVAEGKIYKKGRGTVLGWRLTEDGEKYKPIASFAIHTEVKWGKSMYEILGQTASGGESRSPYNRAKILMKLREEGELRRTDLMEELKIHGEAVRKHLVQLKKLGFVEYESVSTGEKGWSRYRWEKGRPSQVKAIRSFPTLTKKVAELLYNSGEWMDRNEIAEKLGYKNPEPISMILSGLERQRFVKTEKFKGGKKQSEARITEAGARFVNEFLYLVYEALEDDDILKGIKEEYQDTYENNFTKRINDCTYVTQLYAKVAPSFKRRPTDERKDQIYFLLKERGRMRPIEIKKLIGIKNVTVYLKELINESLVKKSKEGGAVYYEVVE